MQEPHMQTKTALKKQTKKKTFRMGYSVIFTYSYADFAVETHTSK